MAIYFSANTSNFLTGGNLETLLPYFAPFAILAAGEVFVMILGEIDLSIAAMYLFAPIIYYKLNTSIGLPLGLVADRRAAHLPGGRRGERRLRVRPRHQLVRHDAGDPVHVRGPVADHLQRNAGRDARVGRSPVGTFGKVFGAGTYSELIWAIAIVVLLQVVLTFTRWGLYTVAIGSNKLGAAEAGVRVNLVMIRNFMLCALTAGLVGIFEAIRAQTVQPNPAGPNEILFFAVAAAVIGGTLLTGGSGTVVGALIGALFLGILKDGLILQGVQANYLLFYTGLAVIVAMTANVFVGRARRGHTGSG